MSGAFHSVSVSVFNRYLGFGETAGISRSELLRMVGTNPVADEDPDARVDFGTYKSLVQSSVAISGDPSLPLRYPLETKLDSATIVGLIIQSSNTLGQALQEVNRFAKLMMEIDIMAGAERHPIEISGATARFLDCRPDPNQFPELTEIALGRIIFETGAIFPEEQFAKAVTVTHPRPAHADLYERYWKCPVTFGAPKNAVEFDANWLSRKFEHANAYALALFSEKPHSLNSDLRTVTTFAAKSKPNFCQYCTLGRPILTKLLQNWGRAVRRFTGGLRRRGLPMPKFTMI